MQFENEDQAKEHLKAVRLTGTKAMARECCKHLCDSLNRAVEKGLAKAKDTP